MSNFNKFLTFDSRDAYESAYDLQMKKNYSNPKIYDANGDLSKRWYVYFSYRDPVTGKLKRMTPFYGQANKYKTKSDRMFVLVIYRNKIKALLKRGYNPFENNSELFQKEKQATIKPKKVLPQKTNDLANNKSAVVSKTTEIKTKTISEAFEFALNLKKKLVNEVTLKAYTRMSNRLQKFIKKNFPTVTHIDQLTKSIIVQFLNSILEKNSPRTRNNARIDIGSLIQVLAENEIITTNFVKHIPVLKSIPERNKTYTNQLDAAIYSYLEEKDPILLLYIKFISYNFLRPIEVNRLKIGDINLKEKTISYRAKNKPLQTKIIPDILVKDLPDLSKFHPEAFLITPDKFGAPWNTSEINKRNYFSKRFKTVVKDHFKLDKNYGLYSFRHTYITKLYRELRKIAAPNEAKSRLMLITGHATMVSLEKYLRNIDAELPEDYSALFKVS